MNSKTTSAIRGTTPAIEQCAKELRWQMTPSEKRLWLALKGRQVDGLRFRTQHPVGRFILDFYCAAAKLAIEIDGDTHAEPDQAAYDAARTDWLEARGYRVIRFDNGDVHKHLDSVVAAIQAACVSGSSP